ncbi:hypothetical protein [Edaphobacter bradus]|uniref:hypothetical protein n=1 Tax=Edaphobacter bradus TaxID=2259016 RepID=UPI0021DF8A04|nr:hypothetical protein [Edaphobacter bradus]
MNDAIEKILREREADARAVLPGSLDSFPRLNVAARASLVNRTHRVVRARAQALAAQRSRARSLWIPLAVCSGLLVIICTAVWSLLDQYELAPNGVPDASEQFLVLLLWFLPVSVALMTMVWFRRIRTKRSGREFTR